MTYRLLNEPITKILLLLFLVAFYKLLYEDESNNYCFQILINLWGIPNKRTHKHALVFSQ